MKRRTFLKSLAGAALAGSIRPALSARLDYFKIHPFITAHPDAVFIMKTNVDSKHDSGGLLNAGKMFSSSVFQQVSDSEGAFPLSHRVVIKPNLTSRGKWQDGYTTERSMGVITDVNFVEGVIRGMYSLGIDGSQFYVREVNGVENLTEGGYRRMGERTGADVDIIPTSVDKLDSSRIVWKDIPKGVWFKRIPYLWPVNAANTVLLNMAKFKTHAMGMTLCAKNLQGSIVSPYQRHCTAWNKKMDINIGHIQTGAKQKIYNNWQQHVNEGIPRWDRPGSDGGLWQETWAARCLDNNSVTKPVLNIIEGIYGHDGHFIKGPHDGFAKDFMSNVIIFGQNAFHVDIVGTWLAGHEPGNFGLFHMAMERGMSRYLNPMDIPVYNWSDDGHATLALLSSFERTPLKTYYLQRDYNSQNEDYWHLCNEPYDYGSAAVGSEKSRVPDTVSLNQNYPNPFNDQTCIEFALNKSGPIYLDIVNARGQVVDVLVNRSMTAGLHRVIWNSGHYAAGTYFYRLRTRQHLLKKRMTLVK